MTLGKMDETGSTLKALDSILLSGAKFSEKLAILADHRMAEVPQCRRRIDGPNKVFEKLWKSTRI